MVTVTITIKPYLARYMYVRYAQSLEPESESRPSPSSSASLRKPIPIHLSHITPIYHFLYQLSSSDLIRPASIQSILERNRKYHVCSA